MMPMDRPKQLLVFLLDDRRYGLPLGQVQRVIRAVDAPPLPDAPAIVLGIIDLQGTILPLFNLRGRFGFLDRPVEPADHFIIARALGRTVALAVDTVSGMIDYPADRVVDSGAILDGLELIAGAIQLDEGLVLIHDLDRFLTANEQRELEGSLRAVQA
jgi:purine-binding chemotaxis protein CheW